MKPDLVSGSPLWQTVFVSFAVVLLLFQILRGWRLGLPRQLVRIVALVAAYSTALFGGKAALPIFRPLVKVPDFVISALGAAIMAMIVYSLINTVGTIVFKRTGQQQSPVIRLVYGFSGAVLGLFFGLFFIGLLVIGIRSLGAVAEAQVNASLPDQVPAFRERSGRSARRPPAAVPEESSLAVSLAKLKKSIELGAVGEVAKQADVLPHGSYDNLTKVGEVMSSPAQASRFFAYPGVAQVADNPKLLALRADPEIQRMVEQGRLLDLLQDDRVIEAANDPELGAQLKNFDFTGALDYAKRDSQ